MKQDEKTNCPVCGMEVDENEHEITYKQMRFAFCSDQCKERFLAHPHIYIGFPGQPAPKQEGQVELKRRRLHLSEPLSVDDAALVQQVIGAMMGVNDVSASGNRIDVTYDLLQVGLKELGAALQDVGAQLGGDWIKRLKYALLHESEELQLESRKAIPPHHYRP